MADIIPFPMTARAESLPNRIRLLREDRGLQIADLAFEVGCSSAYLSEMERGVKNISQRWMERIAKVLHVPPQDLFWPSPDRSPVETEADRLSELYRRGSPAQREALMRVAELMIDYRAGPPAPTGDGPDTPDRETSATVTRIRRKP